MVQKLDLLDHDPERARIRAHPQLQRYECLADYKLDLRMTVGLNSASGRSTILQASVPGENSTTCSGPSPQRKRRVCPLSSVTKGIRCRRKRPISTDSGANFRSMVARALSVHRPSGSGPLNPARRTIPSASGEDREIESPAASRTRSSAAALDTTS